MSETTVSVLTPPGKSALAVLALRGPRAWEAARAVFRPRRGDLPDAPEPGRFWLGKAGDDARDDAVLACHPTLLELHTHGGREVVRWLTDLLVGRGLVVVPWAETIEAPLESITAAALAQTGTVRTAAVALDQHTGTLRRALEALRDADDPARYETLRRELLRWWRFGEHLTTPWRVVIAGAPNAGKSSLLNALAGYQRSIVSALPGTTRDVVSAGLAIDGWPVEVCDTAGLRAAREPVEGQGVELAREAIASADLCLWLLDSTCEPVFPAETTDNVRLVVNKIDRPAAWDLARAGDSARVSAMTGEGLDRLCESVSAWLVPEVPPPGTAVPVGASARLLAMPGEASRPLLRELLA